VDFPEWVEGCKIRFKDANNNIPISGSKLLLSLPKKIGPVESSSNAGGSTSTIDVYVSSIGPVIYI
jgi:hypothetical protein